MKKMILFLLAGFVLLAGVSAVTVNTARDNAQAYHLEQMRTLLAQVAARGALISLNHPKDSLCPYLWEADEGFQIGRAHV